MKFAMFGGNSIGWSFIRKVREVEREYKKIGRLFFTSRGKGEGYIYRKNKYYSSILSTSFTCVDPTKQSFTNLTF